MADEIVLKNNDVLIKFINCLERVLFVDNRCMKDYGDIREGVEKEYQGISLYLKKILESLAEEGASILAKNLPEQENIKKYSGGVKCVVLDSFSNSYYLNENQEDKQYVVVACPDLERVFHFKTSAIQEASALQNSEINDFSYHPLLPRIKIYTRNFEVKEGLSNLSNLKFLYTLLEDASIQTKSYREINSKVCWNELVSDPAYGVQVGNMGAYFISPLKIVGLKRDIENLHQLRLIAEENNNEFEICIRTSQYRKLFNFDSEEGYFNAPIFLRSLLFQGFGEDFRHLLLAEKITAEEFKEDSFFSYIRFRRSINKEDVSEEFHREIPNGIIESNNRFYYFPKGFSPEIFDTAKEFREGNKLSISFSLLKKYHDFKKLYNLHPDWEEIYEQDIAADRFYRRVIIKQPNPWGIHRSFIRDPLQKLTFYTKNKELSILCATCFNFKNKFKTKDIPEKCPLCNSKTFVSLEKEEDEDLIRKAMKENKDDKKADYYIKMSGLAIGFNKFLFYTLNFTHYALSTCVKILNELKKYFDNEDIFFEKLYKISQSYNRKEDIYSLMYKLEKNEV
jgi:hypothetical protein